MQLTTVFYPLIHLHKKPPKQNQQNQELHQNPPNFYFSRRCVFYDSLGLILPYHGTASILTMFYGAVGRSGAPPVPVNSMPGTGMIRDRFEDRVAVKVLRTPESLAGGSGLLRRFYCLGIGFQWGCFRGRLFMLMPFERVLSWF